MKSLSVTLLVNAQCQSSSEVGENYARSIRCRYYQIRMENGFTKRKPRGRRWISTWSSSKTPKNI